MATRRVAILDGTTLRRFIFSHYNLDFTLTFLDCRTATTRRVMNTRRCHFSEFKYCDKYYSINCTLSRETGEFLQGVNGVLAPPTAGIKTPFILFQTLLYIMYHL